jgi:hypothetical protein
MPTQAHRCGGGQLLPLFDPVLEGTDRSAGRPSRLSEGELYVSFRSKLKSEASMTTQTKKMGRTEIREIFLYYKWLL